MNHEETRCAIALTKLPGIGTVTSKRLCMQAGSASLIWEHRHDILALLPDLPAHLVDSFSHFDQAMNHADAEMEFIVRNNIRTYTLTDEDYPGRLRSCPDAPIVMFQCGNADLGAKHVLSVVGSRRCTDYGRDICRQLIHDLAAMVPGLLIVSGVAYGIDINAHRAALAEGLPTVAVMAHGLDRIYPPVHRQTAAEMASHGGLLTEYVSGTKPERTNFIARNRIIAALADATLVVESGERSGSLITAEMAQCYGRELLAVPGRASDIMSQGCNSLISKHRAALIQSASDIARVMNWGETMKKNQAPVQQNLFHELEGNEKTVCDLLSEGNTMQVNQIVVQTGLTYSEVSYALYELESKGLVELTGGARYRIISTL